MAGEMVSDWWVVEIRHEENPMYEYLYAEYVSICSFFSLLTDWLLLLLLLAAASFGMLLSS